MKKKESYSSPQVEEIHLLIEECILGGSNLDMTTKEKSGTFWDED